MFLNHNFFALWTREKIDAIITAVHQIQDGGQKSKDHNLESVSIFSFCILQRV
jgi:hypothetical protein